VQPQASISERQIQTARAQHGLVLCDWHCGVLVSRCEFAEIPENSMVPGSSEQIAVTFGKPALTRQDAGNSAKRWMTEQVLREEVSEIREKEVAAQGSDFYREMNALGLSALCLSGGGIRSAAFALGVIQSFARHPRPARKDDPRQDSAGPERSLLAQFDYMSTVSGGGYIGSWLSAWRKLQLFAEIEPNLIGRPKGPDTEPSALEWLRSFSNYLTPKTGLLSADTWTAAGLTLRNLLLNWVVILTPVCAFIFFVKLIGVFSNWVAFFDIHERDHATMHEVKSGIQILMAFLGFVCLVWALKKTTEGRPMSRAAGDRGPTQAQFFFGTVLLSVLASFFLVDVMASDFLQYHLLSCKASPTDDFYSFQQCPGKPLWDQTAMHFVWYAGGGFICGALVYFLGWWLASRPRNQGLFSPSMWAVSGGVYGILVAGGFYFYLVIPDQGIIGLPLAFFHIVLGIPYLLLAQFFAESVFVGLSSYREKPNSEAEREWFARAAGWFLTVAAILLAVLMLLYFGMKVAQEIGSREFGWWSTLAKSALPLLAAGSGWITAAMGKSAFLPASGESKGPMARLGALILPAVGMLFAGAVFIIISSLLDLCLFGQSLLDAWNREKGATIPPLLIGLVVSVALSGFASRFININRFSLHAMYRNRLVRAFLGAARDRNPDRFTGFDFSDDIPMRSLWGKDNKDNKDKPRDWRPFHVINIALNVVSSNHLAWQERKAEPFTVTPLRCGSSRLGYRDTEEYGGGITLGTAMAISGAAASPNMGYYSSPGVTFLMSMLNVRLGWWLGNPGSKGDDRLRATASLVQKLKGWLARLLAKNKDSRRGLSGVIETVNDQLGVWLDKSAAKTEPSYLTDGPPWAIAALLFEAFGRTTDDRRYVYLSDGGHFENLGLYEMVRRRCRYIVISDATCESGATFSFWDLGDSIRKISIDLGISIRFLNLDRLKKHSDDARNGGHVYHAIGVIDYHDVDAGCENGYILYIKAAYHGSENAAVRAYAAANPDFPHQGTSNQWFSESQFESYRALGFEITERILDEALGEEPAPNASLKDVLQTLYERAKAVPQTPVS
jgi:hypothetical protein